MEKRKSYFATEDDYNFFGNGTLSKLLIDFDCLFKGEWKGDGTVLADNIVGVFKKFQKLNYKLFLIDVPEYKEILEWLDKSFDYDFVCNDYPTRYADLCDHWTSISRKIETSLCKEGQWSYNRDLKYEENWEEIFETIKANDVIALTESASSTFDDVDWNQAKEENGLADGSGKQVFGSSYIPVEKMNEKTTVFLKTIAKARSESPVSYPYKPVKERWTAEAIWWDVNEEIASKYGVKIEIEQGSLYYRGTWLKIKVKAPYKKWPELREICKKFCADYGFDKRKELIILNGYELPWTQEQKKREEEDDRVDSMFDSMDD